MIDIVAEIEASLDRTKDRIRCGFCCKTVRQVRKMVKSEDTGVAICDQCVAIASELVK